jgi:hypothetical protein
LPIDKRPPWSRIGWPILTKTEYQGYVQNA